MRLWSLHPQYLDAKGLLAAWREALLARAVLRGQTRGYRLHPQLARFRAAPRPVAAINHYLRALLGEARRRGYRFDARKLGPARTGARPARIAVSSGQMAIEWQHLQRKLRQRDPAKHAQNRRAAPPRPHSLFRIVAGPPADWERAK